MSVYDYSNIADIKKIATLASKDLGYDGSSRAKTCDPTYKIGSPPSPHGCATSAASGKAYCNVTATGQIVIVDLDADPPTFAPLTTSGAGGGYTKSLPGGGFVYSVAGEPREGGKDRPGGKCQIGQLVVIDARAGAIAKEVPLLYKGPGCQDTLVGTDEETSEPGHMQITHDKKTLYVTPGGGFGVATARVRQELVFDISDPANPVQLPSIAVGESTSHVGDLCTGDGKLFASANNIANTVTVIDAEKRTFLRTITTKVNPLTIASWASGIGPSHTAGPIE
jgi:hypothetical protein